jgi:hypothetical protein
MGAAIKRAAQPRVDLHLVQPAARDLDRLDAWHWISESYCALNVVVAVELPVPLALGAVVEASRGLMRSFPLLRTRVEVSNGGARQSFLFSDHPEPDVEQVSLSAEKNSRYWVEYLLNKPFDSATGPMWRVLVAQQDPLKTMLFIGASHLIVDGHSLNRVAASLLALCGIGCAPLFPGAQSVNPGAGDLAPQKFRGVLGLLRSIGGFYLRDLVHDLTNKPVRLKPESREAVSFNDRKASVCERRIDGAEASGLKAMSVKHGVSVAALIQAAMAKSMADEMVDSVTERTCVAIGSSVHLRDEFDGALKSSLGSSVLMIRALFERPHLRNLLDLAKEGHQAFQRRVSQGEHWMGWRLMDFAGPRSISQSKGFVAMIDQSGPGHVSVNDLSGSSLEKLLPDAGISSRTYVSLSISGWLVCVVNEGAGAFDLCVSFVPKLLSRSRAERLTDGCVNHLFSGLDLQAKQRFSAVSNI